MERRLRYVAGHCCASVSTILPPADQEPLVLEPVAQPVEAREERVVRLLVRVLGSGEPALVHTVVDRVVEAGVYSINPGPVRDRVEVTGRSTAPVPGGPEHPDDLLQHRCLRIRLGDDSIYPWELEQGEATLALDVPGTITIDDTSFAIELARAGTALAYLPEPVVSPLFQSDGLRAVLQDWSPMGSGFHIYYPGRRQLPTGLRLLIDLIRELRPLGY